jgi:hypothetical protein
MAEAVFSAANSDASTEKEFALREIVTIDVQ